MYPKLPDTHPDQALTPFTPEIFPPKPAPALSLLPVASVAPRGPPGQLRALPQPGLLQAPPSRGLAPSSFRPLYTRPVHPTPARGTDTNSRGLSHPQPEAADLLGWASRPGSKGPPAPAPSRALPPTLRPLLPVLLPPGLPPSLLARNLSPQHRGPLPRTSPRGGVLSPSPPRRASRRAALLSCNRESPDHWPERIHHRAGPCSGGRAEAHDAV